MRPERNIRYTPPILLFDFGGVVQELKDEELIHTVSILLHKPIDQVKEWFDDWIPAVQTGLLCERDALKKLLGPLEKTPMPEDKLLTYPFRNGSYLIAEMVVLLDELANSGASLAVLSNTIPSHAQLNIKRNNFRWFRSNVFLSHEIGVRKPDLKAFTIVCDSFKAEPADFVLIDDSVMNLNAATALGMGCIYFDNSRMTVSELRLALAEFGDFENCRRVRLDE